MRAKESEVTEARIELDELFKKCYGVSEHEFGKIKFGASAEKFTAA